MITILLLHPSRLTLVQRWVFENESVIRIGRATDNQVVLYSAVVSRRHVELRGIGRNWEIVNLSANGTYLDGKPISHISVVDGVIVRLASSGPMLQIRFGAVALKQGMRTTQGFAPSGSGTANEEGSYAEGRRNNWMGIRDPNQL